MMRKFGIPALAVIGLLVGFLAVKRASHKYVSVPPVVAPVGNPFENSIAASGIVEPASRSIGLSPETGGLVTAILVQWNQQVRKGQRLLVLDPTAIDSQIRQAQANVLVGQAQLQEAEANLAKLKSPPRAIDRPAYVAAVAAARADYRLALGRWKRVKPAIDTKAFSSDDLANRRYAWLAAQADLAKASAALAAFNAGTWSRDIAIGESEVVAARATVVARQADLDALKTQRGLLTVRSPIAGTVLKINTRIGQYVAAASFANLTNNPQSAPLIIGDIRHLNVRLQIDQEDASRFVPGQPAVCFVRGMPHTSIGLTFVRIDPFVLPKQDLTGAPTEQVETRVLQVVFRLKRPSFPVYVGQQVDAFLKTPYNSRQSGHGTWAAKPERSLP